jgi:hypothetical protein
MVDEFGIPPQQQRGAEAITNSPLNMICLKGHKNLPFSAIQWYDRRP